MKNKKLPLGIYTLKTIIEENYLYIDKTEIALDIIRNNRYVFLSRPRRFGKSLFLDTLKEIFEGNKELFKDLYIYNNWNFEKKHPVIRISFASGKVKTKEEFDKKIISILEYNQEHLGIKCKDTSSVAICFEDLIKLANEKYSEKVVILIDEYDKPILDNILSYEGYYASVIYAYLASLGLNIIAEDVTNKGRIDLTVIINKKVYILEFKVLNSTPKTNTALNQIIKNKYHEKYLTKYSKIYQIGIIFNEKKRNIVKFNSRKVVA